MKHFFFSFFVSFLLIGMGSCQANPPERFTLSNRTEVDFDKSHTELSPLAAYLSDHLHSPQSSNEKYNVIRLDLDKELQSEEFRLEIRATGIRITGGSYGGVFNGIQALFELLPPEIYAKDCPATILQDTLLCDKPRYAYRSMMLDVARTWCDAERVKRQIDLLAYHRINRLHLHLTDDEGWRIEIKSHPELAQVGGFRGGDSPIRPVYGKWDEKYGGYYTQEQMRSIIEYAAVRNIQIIPEIDLPGHSRAIAAIHPEIRCNFKPNLGSTHGYDYRSAWCVARKENYDLLEDILGEICALFPSEYIHIGGDEVDMDQWSRCPDCQRLMREKGMSDPHELEDLFMARTCQILMRHGKRAGVWNEAIFTGKFTKESLVYGWIDLKSCLKATANGYRTVVMPGKHFYLDMRQSRHEDGHDWAGIVDARTLFEFDFEKAGFTPEQARLVEGFEAAFWSEAYASHTPEKASYLDYMSFPRLTALAHLGWHGTGGDWDSFYKDLVEKHYPRLAAMGVEFRLFPPKVSYRNGMLTVSVDDHSELYYTDSTKKEHRYTAPIQTTNPKAYQFQSRYGTGRSPRVAHTSYYKRLYPKVVVSSSMGESTQFPYTNAAQYRGITRTRRNYHRGDWIRYDFEFPQSCKEIFVQTGNPQLPKSIFIEGRVEISYNGQDFEQVGTLENGCYTIRNPRKAIHAIRIEATTDRNDGTPFVTIEPLKIYNR